MKYVEKREDLFKVPADQYVLAHCISADFALGAGIAKKIDTMFGVKDKLNEHHSGLSLDERKNIGCFMVPVYADPVTGQIFGMVLNIVTKLHYFEKPTYQTLRHGLIRMKELCLSLNIDKIAMPTIGCGLDKLEWSKVSEIIKDVFNDTDIEILICIH